MYKIIKKAPLCLAVSCCLLMTGVTEAKVRSVTGQLSLMAMLDGKPAFRSVLWKLTLNSNKKRSAVKILKRHAATVDLEPGNYKVSVSFGNKTLTRHVTIRESAKQSLIVSLD